MSRIIVERNFEPPLTEEELKATEARMAPCLELYDVRWLRSFWSGDRRRMICEYEAQDVASVRNVQREAAAKFERVWAADVLEETPIAP
ncbi:nickel-binding protein [Flaviflagellibacter deserti]|uniref:Nickel-binding protein n=1 Tax=Flaviflagellibacter deserti TaxID=2267266 RepID=A0ABV9Z2J9_9HYPH